MTGVVYRARMRLGVHAIARADAGPALKSALGSMRDSKKTGLTLALAPFPLPKAVRVNRYWSFKKSAGDTPTLPIVVFQIYALEVHNDFIRLMGQVDPHLAEKLLV